MSEMYEVVLDSPAYGGEALGRLPDGRIIFVPYAIPGERVRLRIVEDKPRHARGELVDVLEASTERITPRCAHFQTCGGCHYQHMTYSAQLDAKAAILREQLERIGNFHRIPDIELMAADNQWYYRNTIQFHITREGKLGYQQARSAQAFAIRECHLPVEAINRVWPQIEVEPAAQVDRLNVRAGVDEEMLLTLESSQPEIVDFSIEDLAVSVVQIGPAGCKVLAGSDHLLMKALGKEFQVSAGAFFQVNINQAEAIVNTLLNQVSFDVAMTLVDAYCGVGLFSAFLAPKVKRLIGIEISSQACEDYAINLDEFENVELYEDAVENVLAQISFQPDVIVMDPPRAGLGVKTVEGILAQGARQLAYVSCDPATMARDGKQLATGGYQLSKIALIDMFPQTYHIESLSLWEK